MRFPIWRPFRHFRRSSRSQILFYSISGAVDRTKMNPEVKHDEAKKEFYIDLGNEKAVLQYEFLGSEVMDMYHTGVPESQRGKGLAGHLVKAALSHVVGRNLKIKPTCSYVQHYIEKNKSQDIIERIV